MNQQSAYSQPVTNPVNQVSRLKQSFFSKHKLVKVVSGIGLLLLVIFVYRFFLNPSTLTVIGQGEYSFSADKVSFVVTHVNAQQDSASAIDQGQQAINRLIQAVQTTDDQAKIKKAFYQVNPTNQGSQLVYQVVNAFSVETHKVDQIDSLVKSLYSNGATTISGVTFGSSQEDEMTQKAREAAVQDAKQEAKRIAKAAGKRLGGIVAINDDLKTASGTVGDVSSGEGLANFKNVSLNKQVSLVYRVW